MQNNHFGTSKFSPFAPLVETPPKYCIHPPNTKSPFSKSLTLRDSKQKFSPRRTLGSIRCKSQKFRLNQKLESMASQEEITANIDQLVNALEKEDFSKINWSKIYGSDKNCRIHPGEIHSDLSDEENKLFKRINSTVSKSERNLSLSLAAELKDSLDGISYRLKHEPNSESFGKEDIESIQSQLDVYFTVLHESVKEISSHSKSLGLLSEFVHSEILNICRKFLKTIEISNDVPKEAPIYEIRKPTLNNTNQTRMQYLESEIDRIRRENESLLQQLDRQNYETFALKAQVNQTDTKINNLLTVNQSLRDAITEKEHQQFTEQHKNTTYEFDKTLACVPHDVYSIWNDISQFSKFILDGNLLKFDIEKVLPPELIKNPNSSRSPEFEFIKNLDRLDEPIHFSTFFTNMKKYFGDYSSEPLFHSLGDKFNEFVRAVFNVYKKRANDEIERNNLLMKKVHTEIENSTSDRIDRSSWIRSLASTNMLVTTPFKDQSYDIFASISKVTTNLNKLMKKLIKPRFTSAVINETFSEGETIEFLSNIMKYSKTDMFVDLFRKFIVIEIPFHAFLFFAKFWNNMKNISPQDHKSQLALIPQMLKNSGYQNLSNLVDLEKTYCTSNGSLCAFAIAVYLKLIENIEASLNLESNNLKEEIKRQYSLNDEDLNDSWEFMKALAVDPMHPTKTEMAVLGFTKRIYPSDSLKEFDPEQSPLCEYILNFGKSPKKQKKSK